MPDDKKSLHTYLFKSYLSIHKCMSESLGLVPVATGKVGHFHWRAVVLYRDTAQLSQAAPLRQVIHIHVQR